MILRLALTASALTATSAGADVIAYQPSQGTLPSAQGWTYLGDGSEIGAVAGGVLTYGPTATAAVHTWDYEHASTVDFSTQTWTMQARVRLTDTFLGNNSGFRRGGFVLSLEDDFGRGIIAELGDAGISLRNDNNGLSDPILAMDMATEFRTVTLEAGPLGARLLVDGVEQLTSAFGSLNSSQSIYWGEGSILAYTGLTEVSSARIVPAPASTVLVALGTLTALRRRR